MNSDIFPRFKVGQRVRAQLFYATVFAVVTDCRWDANSSSYLYSLSVNSITDSASGSMEVSRVPESSLQSLSHITG